MSGKDYTFIANPNSEIADAVFMHALDVMKEYSSNRDQMLAPVSQYMSTLISC